MLTTTNALLTKHLREARSLGSHDPAGDLVERELYPCPEEISRVLSTIDRYLLGRILGTFLPMCVGLCFLFFVGASFRLLKEEDLALGQVVLALPWVLPFLLPYLVPMAYAATLSLVYGRMVADNEVLAFGSLGIPGRTLAWPAILLAGLLTAFCAWVTTTLVPHCHQMRKEAARAVFQQLFSLRDGEHLSRAFVRQNFDLYVRSYSPQGLRGIVIHYAPSDGEGAETQLVAERGHVAKASETKRLVLVLENVTATIHPSEAKPPVRLFLEQYVQEVSLGGWRRHKVHDFPSASLRREAAKGKRRLALAAATGGIGASHLEPTDLGLAASVELATRTTLSLAPLLMALLALPVPLLLRAKSALVPFVVGMVVVCGLFFGPMLLGQFLAQSLHVEWLAYLAVPCALIGSGALALTAKRR